MKVSLKKPQYGNWVSTDLLKRMFVSFAFFALASALLWMFVAGWYVLKLLMSLTTLFFMVGSIYFLLARRLFAAEGGNIQSKVLDALTKRIIWSGDGEALDIGCGSGALSIRIAKEYPRCRVTGIDDWGKGWSYCMEQCEENARIEGVEGRLLFRKASAASLPFEDESFDLVVSNLTFHEVKDCTTKLDVVREALRVVKPGGVFAFQDLFLLRRYFGTTEELVAALKKTSVQEVYFEDTSNATYIPKALKLPFMIGTLGLLYGVK